MTWLWLVLLAGCNNPPVIHDPPTVPPPQGTYRAVELDLLHGGDVLDNALSQGGHMLVTVAPDRSFTGEVLVPAPWRAFQLDTVSFDVKLGGYWAATDSLLYLTGLEQTVLAHLTFRRDVDTLRGSILIDSVPDDCCNNTELLMTLLPQDTSAPSTEP